MNTIDVVITLEDDCVFSERNATEGVHQALDYIPGNALLGAVASQLYPKIDSNKAFEWFHSGKVRFNNAYPLINGQRTYPIPACWHQAKGQSASTEGRLNSKKLWRLDVCPDRQLPDNQQPQQLRNGYISLDGQIAEPRKSMRLKTAISASTGRAKDSALYGYDALQAGQSFYTQITWTENDEALNASLIDIFSKPIFLGRSRSAEYGRAKAEIVTPQTLLNSDSDVGNEITLWLLSDLMALDSYGQATLAPSPQELGLPDGRFNIESSFLRTRRYSTWNAHKQGYEMERQVICKGSVLVYTLEDTLTPAHIQHIAAGLGTERQSGLGQVWLNPPLLRQEQPSWQTSPVLLSTKSSLTKPDRKPELIEWLEAQVQDTQVQDKMAQDMRQVAKLYVELLTASRDLKGLPADVPVGPSMSQWGEVLSQLKTVESNAAFKQWLEHDQGSCKPKGPGWKDETSHNNKSIRFYDWFSEQYEQQADLRYMQHLVREIMATIKNNAGVQA